MIEPTSWLPGLIQLEDYGGNWTRYLDAVYTIFKRDFIDSKPSFLGYRMGLKRHRLEQGKEVTFWHFISEGIAETNRLPDLRRCERIAWPKPIIEAAQTDRVRSWRNIRRREQRILIALSDFSYVVVLADRGEYILPWTAYLVEERHQREKLQKEYEAFKASKKC